MCEIVDYNLIIQRGMVAGAGLGWVGLGCALLGWIGQCWAGLGWPVLDCVGLGWVWVLAGMGWAASGLDVSGRSWVRLGRKGADGVQPGVRLG